MARRGAGAGLPEQARAAAGRGVLRFKRWAKSFPPAALALSVARRAGFLPTLQRRYPAFTALLCREFGLRSLDDSLDPLARSHLDFAVSTVARGREVRDGLARHVRVRDRAVLDVGCAYGGFLAAFSEYGASRVVGLEVQEPLLRFARALREDLGFRAELVAGDLLAPDLPARLGTFDLVCLNDVIEHVADPALAVARVAALLNPGGAAFFQVPNRLHPAAILRDGHFGLFGVSLLGPREAGRRVAEALPGRVNDVHYESLTFYRSAMTRCGMRFELLDAPSGDPELRLEAAARALHECLAQARSRSGDSASGPRVVLRLERLCRAFDSGLRARAGALTADRPRADAMARKLLLAFDTPFWRIFARKHAARPGRLRAPVLDSPTGGAVAPVSHGAPK